MSGTRGKVPSRAAAMTPAKDQRPMAAYAERIRLNGRTLRQHSARGSIVNAAFVVAVNSLALVRGFAVAALITTTDYGVWGILAISIGMLTSLRQLGVGEKFVQQSEDDQ